MPDSLYRDNRPGQPGHYATLTRRLKAPDLARQNLAVTNLPVLEQGRRGWWYVAPMHTSGDVSPDHDNQTDGETAREPAKLKVLVVEDEAIVALDLMATLRRMGHTVVGHTLSGEEAIQSAAIHRPDLILMDIRLQGLMDGIQAARHIRTRFSGIRVIFLSAFVDEETLQRVDAIGLGRPLRKPFSKFELQSAIENEML